MLSAEIRSDRTEILAWERHAWIGFHPKQVHPRQDHRRQHNGYRGGTSPVALRHLCRCCCGKGKYRTRRKRDSYSRAIFSYPYPLSHLPGHSTKSTAYQSLRSGGLASNATAGPTSTSHQGTFRHCRPANLSPANILRISLHSSSQGATKKVTDSGTAFLRFQVKPEIAGVEAASLAPPIINTAWLTDTQKGVTTSATVIVNAEHAFLPLLVRNRWPEASR